MQLMPQSQQIEAFEKTLSIDVASAILTAANRNCSPTARQVALDHR